MRQCVSILFINVLMSVNFLLLFYSAESNKCVLYYNNYFAFISVMVNAVTLLPNPALVPRPFRSKSQRSLRPATSPL